MAVVQRAQIQEVEDKDDLAKAKLSLDPTHNEQHLEDVVNDEGKAHICRGSDELPVGVEKRVEIGELGDQEGEPWQTLVAA